MKLSDATEGCLLLRSGRVIPRTFEADKLNLERYCANSLTGAVMVTSEM